MLDLAAMRVWTKRPATYADLEKLPPEVVGQIIDGELIVSPRPAISHAQVSSLLGAELIGPFGRGRGGPGGWWILDEPELHFGPQVLVPDLAGWRKERLPALPDTAFMTLAPDWVCEVLSPSTASVDRVRKLHIYAREQVRHVWLIDPVERSLEVFRLDPPGWRLAGSYEGKDRARAEPFDLLALELGDLWLPEETPAKAPTRRRPRTKAGKRSRSR